MTAGLQILHPGTLMSPRLTDGAGSTRGRVAEDSSRDSFLIQVGTHVLLRERPGFPRRSLPSLRKHANGSRRRLGSRMRIVLRLHETNETSSITTTAIGIITRTRVEKVGRSNGITIKKIISGIGEGTTVISISESNSLFFSYSPV
jgi:hypothetical protein